MNLDQIRAEYGKRSLTEDAAGDEPFALLNTWLEDAVRAEVLEPNAMVLSTADAAGAPSSRVVLLRGVHDRALRFFSNYHSRKGRELAGRAQAAALFFWPALERQVRVQGTVTRIAPAESDAYFASRPRESRIGALVSPQSAEITRAELDARYAELSAQFSDDVPRPEHWGGYHLNAEYIEFWQGGAHRLHDRIAFRKHPQGWQRSRLAP